MNWTQEGQGFIELKEKIAMAEEEVAGTVWYESKGFWLGFVTLACSIYQAKYGMVIPGEIQGALVGLLVIIVRRKTTGPMTLTKGGG